LREFERIKTLGVAGIKLDFLPGDGQSAIALYHDILEDAARFNLLMNFHGATLPRGLSVLFTSGIQHYAEIPQGMQRAPDYVRDFLRTVPSVWDEIKFFAGYPGRYVVLARRSGAQWFIAGINAEKAPRTVKLDLSALSVRGGVLISDGAGGNLSFTRAQIQHDADNAVTIVM
jgi:hypothetical protein